MTRTNNNNNTTALTNRPKHHHPSRKILLLHGNRQTGQLLLGRMDKLRKKLQRINIQLVAPDAPFLHANDDNLRQWWSRTDNGVCKGLQESMDYIKGMWESDSSFEGILGFSQGARMAHLVALTAAKEETAFEGLKYVIMVAGYDAPLPKELESFTDMLKRT